MKTPSTYPVLDNRPIDQWKVTELKEELKRRKLTTRGLKDDLVRRLDEALRDEIESVKEDDVNNSHSTPIPVEQAEDVGVLDGTFQPINNVDGKGEPLTSEKAESTMAHGNGTEIIGNNGGDSGVNEEAVVYSETVETSTVVTEELPSEGVVHDGEETVDEEVHVTTVKTSITVTESVTERLGMDLQGSPKNAIQGAGENLKTQSENQESGPPQGFDLKSFEVSTDLASQVTQLDGEATTPLHDDVKLNSSEPSNQVSEVSTVLGFQVKNDSVSSDCVFINQNNELKDNIIDDNIKLELDVKPEMVNPSSSTVISDRSEPLPMQPVEEGDKNADLEMSKKNDSLDVGSSEKLNLDRSSGDDSMDDDSMENKPIDSKNSSEGVGDQGEKIERSVLEEAPVVISDDVDMKDADETKKVPAATLVKRKLNDQKVVGNNDISKRQRRWNTENIKVPEPLSNLGSSTTPKEILSTTTLKRNFSRVDSTASEGTPKERTVPPSPKPPTTSLRIDQFVRPFTLKAVQELLGKTGSVTSFWMDHIKTHCYVSYSTVEEATETRNAVYNLQWPPNGGRLLLAEFVDPQEVKTRAEAIPPSPAPLVRPIPTMPPQPSRQQRQQPLPPPPSLPPPPPLSNPPQTRERLPPPPPVEEPEKMDTPIVTLDDLFRKTKTTPRIYYLPLTDEQVAENQKKLGLSA